MECPNCHNPVPLDFVHCKHCGAKIPQEQDVTARTVDDRELTMSHPQRKEDDFELGAVPDPDKWEFPHEEGWAPTPKLTDETAPVTVDEIRWGGFFRRCGAFLIDALVIAALAAVMMWMASVGYKVGLAAHGRALHFDNSLPLIIGLFWATGILATGYFVMLHTITGKTLGKAVLGLRVVGADHEAIGYGRALWRWVGTVVTAPLVLGLLWVLWSREKRAWHDIIAGTWVLRE